MDLPPAQQRPREGQGSPEIAAVHVKRYEKAPELAREELPEKERKTKEKKTRKNGIFRVTQDREVEGENAGSSVKPEQTKGDDDGRGNGYTYARAGALVRGGKHLDAEAEQEGKVDEEESGLIRWEGKLSREVSW